MKEDSLTIGMIVFAVAVIVMAAVLYFQSGKWLKQQAIDTCLNAGVEEYVYPERNTKATVPNKEAYKFCMGEMGY